MTPERVSFASASCPTFWFARRCKEQRGAGEECDLFLAAVGLSQFARGLDACGATARDEDRFRFGEACVDVLESFDEGLAAVGDGPDRVEEGGAGGNHEAVVLDGVTAGETEGLGGGVDGFDVGLDELVLLVGVGFEAVGDGEEGAFDGKFAGVDDDSRCADFPPEAIGG